MPATNTTMRAAGVEELRGQGIERIVATDAQDGKDQVAAITGGAPIVAAVESVGGKAAGDIASVLGENATLVVFGAMASPTLEIPSGKVIFGQLTVNGFWGSVVSKTMPSETKQQLFGELITRVLDGSLTLPVAETFAFEDVQDAVRASDTGGRVGKVLLRPKQAAEVPHADGSPRLWEGPVFPLTTVASASIVESWITHDSAHRAYRSAASHWAA
jgi:NADPH:quinone reductase-like Zn-dependent oxidoreductase